VLPFVNLSSDPKQEYLVDGIVEDIITDLSRFSELFVIARNSTFQYKGKAIDVRQVGRELGVRYVLQGSVRRGGDQVRILVQLADSPIALGACAMICFATGGDASPGNVKSISPATKAMVRVARLETMRHSMASRKGRPGFQYSGLRGEIDFTFPGDASPPVAKQIIAQAPKAICELAPGNVTTNLLVNREVAPCVASCRANPLLVGL
jgi:hypothetical protein